MTRAVALVCALGCALLPPSVSAQSDEDAAPPEPGGGLGLDPSAPQVGDLVLPTAAAPAAAPASTGKTLQFHGYLRVPLRAGFGDGSDVDDGVEGGTKVHVPPHVPDSAYTNWQYTNGMSGPWTELRLSYGTDQAAAHVVLAAYNVTDAGYRDLQSQLGINQAFVTLRTRLWRGRGGLVWNVGAFQGRYGAAGRYDAGKYDTYLFGATHVAGESVAVHYDVSDDLTVQVEHGLGAKLDVVPLVPGVPLPPYLPYPGPVQQGTTLLHHAHLGVRYRGVLAVAAHYLRSWNDDARRAGEVDGSITVAGAELKVIDSVYGNGFLGFARLSSRDVLRLAGAIEVLHSFEGWSLRDNYFGAGSTGTGTIDTLAWQHTFSLAKLLWHPKPFWGQSSDLLVSVFGMYNRVSSDDPAFAGATGKLKLGSELTWAWKSWLGLSLRYDLVQPNLDDSTESFQVISPKLIVRSSFVSNEQVVIQYSRYINGDGVTLAYPFGGLAPDDDVVTISSIMWW